MPFDMFSDLSAFLVLFLVTPLPVLTLSFVFINLVHMDPYSDSLSYTCMELLPYNARWNDVRVSSYCL